MSSMTITPINELLSPAAAARRPRVQPTLRLTRRGRLVVFLVSMLLVLGSAFVLLGGASVATNEHGTPEPTRIVMVHDGQTLWDIAAGIAEEDGTRDMMSRIGRLNALDSGMLYAGQRLRVPTD